jgi:hypothetical protein
LSVLVTGNLHVPARGLHYGDPIRILDHLSVVMTVGLLIAVCGDVGCGIP